MNQPVSQAVNSEPCYAMRLSALIIGCCYLSLFAQPGATPLLAQEPAPKVVPIPARKTILLPPSPLQSKNWTTTFRSFAQAVTPEITPLVLVGDYSGPVQARYELRVFESTDLRNWSQVATLPVSTSWAYMVDRKVASFFHVKAWDTLENKELQGAVSKVVMDP